MEPDHDGGVPIESGTPGLSGEDPLQDKQLVERARHGDQAAWGEIVRLHGEGVYRFAYLKVGDQQAAEDLAQEALVRAYRSLDRFDVTRPLRPWLLSIVANLSRNALRDRSRYLRAVQRWLSEFGLSGRAGPAPGVEHDDSQALWSAIRELPARDQNVIYLRYFVELSVEETAQVIGAAPGTIKSRTHRALGRLKGLLQRRAPELFEEWGGSDD